MSFGERKMDGSNNSESRATNDAGRPKKYRTTLIARWVVASMVVAGLIWLIDVLFSGMSITASQIVKQAIPSAYTFLVCLYIIMVLEIGLVAFFCGLIFRTRSSVVAFGSFLFICCERISLYRMYPLVPAILYNIFLSLATLTLLTLGPCVGFQLSRLGATLRRKWTSSHKKVVVVIFVLIILVLGSVIVWPFLSKTLVGIHQKAITIELSEWSLEYGTIDTWREATHSVDMLGYIEGYYVPGPGYRSHHGTERALEEQRKKTMQTIVKALQQFSGETFGNDPNAWEKWKDNPSNLELGSEG